MQPDFMLQSTPEKQIAVMISVWLYIVDISISTAATELSWTCLYTIFLYPPYNFCLNFSLYMNCAITYMWYYMIIMAFSYFINNIHEARHSQLNML